MVVIKCRIFKLVNMKKIHSIYLMAFVSLLFLASCEKGIETVEYQSTVYIPNSGATTQTVLLGSSEIQLGVYHAGINQSISSVNVTLGIDEAAAATFISNNTGYEILPSSYYTLPESVVKIGKGQERGMYKIQLKGIDENFINKKYFLPISIQSVDKDVAVSETEKLAIIQFNRYRNVYEAKYKAYGQIVLSGTTDTNIQKVDEVVTSTTVDANTIMVKGAVPGLNLLLKVQNGQVLISGATGSEAFNVANTSGKTSTYAGSFSDVYQCNTGTYTLYYTYTSAGKQMDATVELKFWL